jgi:hypothetical protein
MQGLVEKAFIEPFQRLAQQLGEVLPPLVMVTVILIVGGVMALLLRKLMFRLFTWAKFDRLADATGFASAILRTQTFRSPSDFAARLMQGFFWLFIVLLALSAAGTPLTTDLVARFFGYVPDMVTAALVLLLASVVSKFLARSLLLAAVNAQWPEARLLAGTVRVLVMSLGVVIALEQLRIGRTALLVTFAIFIGGFVVAGAIAFGLAARDLAKEWLRTRMKSSDSEQETFHHL